MWYVYIIQCNDGKLYTGITKDVNKRISEHNSGHGGRFTRYRKPVKLVYWREAIERSGALKKEAEIKQLRRNEKLKLISIFKEWRRITKSNPPRLESSDEKLLRFMNIAPITKLQWLRHMQKFTARYSPASMKKIRHHLEVMS